MSRGMAKIVMLQFSSVQSLSRVRLFVTPWTAACQASLSITNRTWRWGWHAPVLKIYVVHESPCVHLISLTICIKLWEPVPCFHPFCTIPSLSQSTHPGRKQHERHMNKKNWEWKEYRWIQSWTMVGFQSISPLAFVSCPYLQYLCYRLKAWLGHHTL